MKALASTTIGSSMATHLSRKFDGGSRGRFFYFFGQRVDFLNQALFSLRMQSFFNGLSHQG